MLARSLRDVWHIKQPLRVYFMLILGTSCHECYLIGGFISGFADLTFMLITQKFYAVLEKLSHQRKDESCDNPYISQKCQNS